MTLSRARPRRRARRRRGRRAAGLPRGRRARRRAGCPAMPEVLVTEKIADSGVAAAARAGFEVERRDGLDARTSSSGRIGEFDGILIRSATQLDADLIERADAPEGDRPRRGRRRQRRRGGRHQARHHRGQRAAVERRSPPPSTRWRCCWRWRATCRRRTRSLTGGAWERSKFSGVEVYEKTLGVLGFGRIGQLVAQRALGFGMHVVAFDAFVAAERFRELGVERAETSDELYAQADFITIHLPDTAETRELARRGGVRADEGRRARDQRAPAASCWSTTDLQRRARLGQGRRRGARRVPRRSRSPSTRCSSYPNVVVTPHLGASTTEATDRAGVPDRRAGGRGAHRRRRHHRREHPGDRARGHGGARRRSCRWRATSAGSPRRWPRARSVDAARGRVPAAASPSATRACSPSRC